VNKLRSKVDALPTASATVCRSLCIASRSNSSTPSFALPAQREELPQSLSVASGGIELDSGGKQRCLIKALKAFSLAFSRLSCSVSVSICALSLLTRKISLSVSLIRCS